MPSRTRKKAKPPPSLSFVTPYVGPHGVTWLKVHSGAARSHAAYWGGPERNHYPDKEQIEQQRNPNCASHTDNDFGINGSAKSASSPFPDPTVRRCRSTKAANAKVTTPPSNGGEEPPHQECASELPLPFEIRSSGSSFEADLSTFEFLGERFVKEFLMVDSKEYPIMYSSYHLLNYAYSMAFTGIGTKTDLLKLKGRLIRHISESIKSSEGVLRPRCLTAILALGAPVVCLASQELPNGRNMGDYIHGSPQGEFLCCRPESATAGRRALNEQIVHRQPMRKFFLTSSANFQDADSLVLLQYLSNHINISMAIESAIYEAAPLVDGEDILQEIDRSEDNSIIAQWSSPITCQWLDEIPTVYREKQMLLLADFTYKWLATFLDRDSNRLESTKELLEMRASLRQRIEGFMPVARNSYVEAEAKYECCRWASLVLLKVDKLAIPIYVAARHVRISPRLTQCLRMTDLPQLWGLHKGLLFWVTAVCHFATVGRCFSVLCTALLARFTQEFAMSEYCSEIAIKPLRRLKQFESLCCDPTFPDKVHDG